MPSSSSEPLPARLDPALARKPQGAGQGRGDSREDPARGCSRPSRQPHVPGSGQIPLFDIFQFIWKANAIISKADWGYFI